MARQDADGEFAWPEEAGGSVPLGFFAYPSSPPMLPPTIRAAIEGINKTQRALIIGWEDLSVNGKFIISEITKAIDDCEFFCADLTGVNPNVMFELGYAIAKNKRIWLVRDGSYIDANKEFEQLRILTTVAYSLYINSANIINSFFQEQPHLTPNDTVFRNSIEPSLGLQSDHPSLLYLKSLHDTEASVYITRSIEDSGIPISLNDPTESGLQPLSWYVEKLGNSTCCLTHYVSPARQGFRLHNARYALISGLATGLNLPTLMLTEHTQVLAPMDYRDLLVSYSTPSEAARVTSEWLRPFGVFSIEAAQAQTSHTGSLRLATQLKDFHVQLGDWVAENERQSLDSYFVETTVSLDIANGTQNVFVGRKGTGKTANLIHADSTIGQDNRNLVCLMKPIGYEIEGLVRLFSRYKEHDTKGYVIESLWKYMLYTEVAFAAHKQITSTSLWELTDPDVASFVALMEDKSSAFAGDFTIRLERVVNSLEVVEGGGTDETFRKGISEALHSGALAKLRTVLSKVLSKKRKVLLLIDNLDKPWTRIADLGELAEFISGLLIATSRLGEQLNRGDRERAAVKFNSAVFLRSDIFERVLEVTLEPDKLAYTRLSWDDPEMLIRVIEERYIASHGPQSDPAVMWKNYFCSEVKGIPTREYLTSRILQRPRDILYLVKAAVSFAVNRKRDRVEEKDVLDGEREYGQYALDSILVENSSTIPELEQLLFEFVGSESIVDLGEIARCMTKARVNHEMAEQVIDQLVRLSFLGIQVGDGEFVYSEESRELKKNRVLSRRYYESAGAPVRYEINKPFRGYLEIRE